MSKTLDKKSGMVFYIRTLFPFLEDLDPATCSDSEAAEIGRALIAIIGYAITGVKPDLASLPRQSRILFRIMEPWKAESEEKYVTGSKGRRYSAYCRNIKKKDRLDRYQWEVEIDSINHPEDYQDENAWSQMPTNEDERSLIKLDCNEQDYVELENDINNVINNVINHLNSVCDKSFRSDSKNTIKLIKTRIKEGYTEQDFIKVIDVKASQWKGKPDYDKNLRPITLFGEKFESYVNERIISSSIKDKDYSGEGVIAL